MSEGTSHPPVSDLESTPVPSIIEIGSTAAPSIIEIESTAGASNSMPESTGDAREGSSEFSINTEDAQQLGDLCLGYPANCVSKDVYGSADGLCGFCKKLDITVLKGFYGGTPEGAAIVEQVRIDRTEKAKAAFSDNILVCALENPRWNGSEWRKEFRPNSPYPCDNIDWPGADEGYFCRNCTESENFTQQYLDVTLKTEKEPHTRLNFPCIWKDDKYKSHWFRDCSRFYPCNGTTRAGYPASMCEFCLSAVVSEADYQNARYWRYFWDDGRLKEEYPNEAQVPRVKGGPPDREVDDHIFRVQGY